MKISQNDRDVLQGIRDGMEAEPGRPFYLQSIAADAGMSRSKFQKIFHVVYGERPYALLREIRMQTAYALLQEQRLSAKEISYRVGFKNLSSFSAAFKKRFGVNPSSVL